MTTFLDPPRQPLANALYRQRLRKWALESKANRRYLIDKCRAEPIWWMSSFCFIYDPREVEDKPKQKVFVPYPYQVPIIEAILASWGKRDVIIEKARGAGATFLCVYLILHDWLFGSGGAFGLVSRNEAAADSAGNMDSVGGKVDYVLAHLPLWMAGKRGEDFTRIEARHLWINNRNESTITAYPATADLAAGGRLTVLMADEFSRFARGDDERAMSASEPVTNMRLFVSTYAGPPGAFHRIAQEESNVLKLKMGWTDDPSRNQNMFRIDLRKQRLLHPKKDEPIDLGEFEKEFWDSTLRKLWLKGFDVEDTSRLWSPWYIDRALRPLMGARQVEEEYDAQPSRTGAGFFPGGKINELIAKTRPPLYKLEIDLALPSLEVERFISHNNGPLHLWCQLSGDKYPPLGEYVVGVDVATGLGSNQASNSVISIANRNTGVKVGEFASPVIKPELLAETSISLCNLFVDEEKCPAYLIWESTGPGRAFGERVMDSSFRNFHYRIPYYSTKRKPTREPGFAMTTHSKKMVLSKYRWALMEGIFDNPSKPALEETLRYEYDKGDKIVFQSIAGAADAPGFSGVSHGDRVIADALACYAMAELNGSLDVPQIRKPSAMAKPPRNSFLERRRRHYEEAARRRRKRRYW